MKAKRLFLQSVVIAGGLFIGFQTAHAQQATGGSGTTSGTTSGTAAMSLVNVCVESSQSSATSGGVIIALPATTDLAALSAYSSFCSVAQSEPLLGTCNCASPTSGTSGTSKK